VVGATLSEGISGNNRFQ